MVCGQPLWCCRRAKATLNDVSRACESSLHEYRPSVADAAHFVGRATWANVHIHPVTLQAKERFWKWEMM
jgi:hypothetical protein